MHALIAETAYVELTLALAVAGVAMLVWRWRRGMAERRISKVLRAYTAGAQVLS